MYCPPKGGTPNLSFTDRMYCPPKGGTPNLSFTDRMYCPAKGGTPNLSFPDRMYCPPEGGTTNPRSELRRSRTGLNRKGRGARCVIGLYLVAVPIAGAD